MRRRYIYEFEDGLRFEVYQVEHISGMVGRNWVYINVNDDAEGGDQWYPTKREAVAALHDYVQHRQWVSPYGWCYVPTATQEV